MARRILALRIELVHNPILALVAGGHPQSLRLVDRVVFWNLLPVRAIDRLCLSGRPTACRRFVGNVR